MKKIKLIMTLTLSTLFFGCASNPNDISASYVSAYKYKDFDCDQIMMEMDHVSRTTVRLYQSLRTQQKNDQAQMGIGLLLFWPTLFLLEGGDGPEAAQYADLKGEYEALRKMSVEKRCEIDMKSPESIIADIVEKDEVKNKRKAGPAFRQ
jgi:hypothetical protein